jgi:hypothetical protein
MLVKLNISIDQCIEAYTTLATRIFGRPKFVGRATSGIVVTRYSGKRLEKVIIRLIKQYASHDEGYTMENTACHKNNQVHW